MHLSNPGKHTISKEEFKTAAHQKAEHLGLHGDLDQMSSDDVREAYTGTHRLTKEGHHIDNYIRDGLDHYVRAARPDLLTQHGVAESLERVHSYNKEAEKELRMAGHI